MSLRKRETRQLHLSRIRKVHAGWLVVFAAVVLTVLGVEAISTTQPNTAIRQMLLGVVGFVSAFGIAFVPAKRLRQASWWLYVGGLLLLLFLLIPGVPDFIVHPRNGARRWINVGVTDFQPSELLKIAFVLAMASHLRFKEHYKSFSGLVIALCVAIPPMVLILVEPDLGTAMLFIPALIAMLVAAGAKYRHLCAIGLLAMVAAYLMSSLLQPHQLDRIDALIAQIQGDDRFEHTIGYQGACAMTLIGAGQIEGVGKVEAAQLLKANHLPEEHNDMVFAVITLRWGLLGAIVTWFLYLLLGLGGICATLGCKDPFPRLVAVGLTTMLLSQMVINTAMTIGLAPITGLTLPFISAGGSSLVVAWLMAGILFGIAMRRDPLMTREGFKV
ncbi:MAG: FtsW/RodA/SpoVE family cell cycle protein [Phycisphaerae bacterium]|nr:FtsW/RodA/SpoVE family cell cycle protein [Phycisphaerae bacterium]MBT6281976.1 FtsW/RodA/SpoVE family cell cycle protein [Phycisphaerae bacterium]